MQNKYQWLDTVSRKWQPLDMKEASRSMLRSASRSASPSEDVETLMGRKEWSKTLVKTIIRISSILMSLRQLSSPEHRKVEDSR